MFVLNHKLQSKISKFNKVYHTQFLMGVCTKSVLACFKFYLQWYNIIKCQLGIFFLYNQAASCYYALLAYHAMAESQKLRYPKKNFSEGEKCHKNKKEGFILNNNRWHRERTRLWSQHEASFLAKYKTTPFFPYCSLVCLFKNSIVDIAQTGTFFFPPTFFASLCHTFLFLDFV